MIQPNGTHAKDIALHFINVTAGRATPAIMKKTVNQAKSLLRSGYTKDEIISVIDYIIKKKGIQIYSLGYINASINDVLKELKLEDIKEKHKNLEGLLEDEQRKQRNEVRDDGESTQRNRNKADGFGVQSGFGKKFDFDLFERK